ncbi:MAG: PKD domain-containing protein [Caldilineaceae bacterium]
MFIFVFASIQINGPSVQAYAASGSPSESQNLSVESVNIVGLTISSNSPQEVGSPMILTATVSSSVGPVTFNWSFGDGATGSGRVVSHAYSAPGDYLVTVIATDDAGSSAASLTVHVDIPETPVPIITPITAVNVVCTTPVVEGDPVNCIASTPGATNVSYIWSFGDNTGGAEGGSVSHIYQAPGTYSVSAVATNSVSTQVGSTQVVILPTAPRGLDIRFNQPVLRGQTALFRATISAGSGVSFQWSFSDGVSGPGITEDARTSRYERLFTENQDYEVTVVAKNGTGELSVTKMFRVEPAPPLGFTLIQPGIHFPNEEIEFIAQTTGGDDIIYDWEFGDGTMLENGPQVTHAYTSTGKYPVIVVARNDVTSAEASTVALVGDHIPMPEIKLQIPKITALANVPIPGISVIRPRSDLAYCWNFNFADNPQGAAEKLVLGSSVTYTYTTAGLYVVEVYGAPATGSCSLDTAIAKGYAGIRVRDEKQFMPAAFRRDLTERQEPPATVTPSVTATSTPTVTATAEVTTTVTPTSTVTITTPVTSSPAPSDTVSATPPTPDTAAPPETAPPAGTPVPSDTPGGTTTMPATPTPIPGSVVLPPPTEP